MKVTFGYSDSEDRMWIRAGHDGVLWWITRRLALRLIAQWGELLERTLPADGAAQAQPEAEAGEAGRRQRARREHSAALSAPPPPDEPDVPPTAGPSALLFSVELSVKGDDCRIVFLSGDKRQGIVLPRKDAHRLLSALASRCRGNGWLSGSLPPWLAPSP